MNNNRLKRPSELTQTRQTQRRSQIDDQLVAHEKLRCLVQLEGWKYVKGIAVQLLAEYECPPPKTEEEREKWENYTRMNWAVNQLLARVEKAASHRPKEERENANNRR